MPVKTHTDVYELPLYSKVRRAIEQAPMESAPMTAWVGGTGCWRRERTGSARTSWTICVFRAVRTGRAKMRCAAFMISTRPWTIVSHSKGPSLPVCRYSG